MKYLAIILLVVTKSYGQVDSVRIQVVGENMVYKGFKIGNRQLLNLVKQYPIPETKEHLLHLHKKLRSNNRGRFIFGIYGMPVTLLGSVLLLTGIGSSGKDFSSSATAFVGVIYFSFGSATIGISQICNYRYHKKKKNIIATYNKFQ